MNAVIKGRLPNKSGNVKVVTYIPASVARRLAVVSANLDVKPAAVVSRALEVTLPAFERGLDPDPSVGKAFADPA